MRGVSQARHAVGASATLPGVWSRRMLRSVAGKARDEALSLLQACDHEELSARRGLELVLYRRALHGTGHRADFVSTPGASWPSLPLAQWSDTRDTLHLWTQIVGKARLALAPMVNHWWQIPLYISARGLTTARIPYGTAGLSVELDFIDHNLQILRDDGRAWSMALAPRSVADFYAAYMSGLRSLGIEVRIWPVPVEIADGIRF